MSRGRLKSGVDTYDAYTMPDGRQQKTAFRLTPLIGTGGELLGILRMATPDAKLLESSDRG
jgi:hypothetical protein